MITKNCAQCGSEFQTKGGVNERLFCSGGCYHASTRDKRRTELIPFTCKVCEKPFFRQPGELRSYRKTFGKDPLYCSTKCGGVGRKLSDEEWQIKCVQCGKPMPIQRRPGGTINRQKKLCSTLCRSQYQSERTPKRFQADATTGTYRKHGYVWISVPAYLHPSGKRTLVHQHRHIMEKMLGRPLQKGETVHHLNGQRADNRPENLELWSKRQPYGQRVVDKVTFAIEMLRLYPEFAKAAGVELREVGGDSQHVEGALSLAG